MQNNGGCSTFCLPTPTGRACACEEGVDLMADGETCEVTGGKKAISSSCFQLHYIHVLFLYMYTSSTCTLIDRCCRTLFMIKDYLNRSVLFWGCSKRCLVSHLSPAPHRDVHLHLQRELLTQSSEPYCDLRERGRMVYSPQIFMSGYNELLLHSEKMINAPCNAV